jgi:hypothetical protein
MKPRTYAIGAIGIPTVFVLLVVALNLVIDPEEVFGTGLLGQSQNINTRYTNVVAYRRDADKVEGLLFGSSRVRNFPIEELSRRTGGLTYASFSFQSGQMNDYLPVLEYILKDKLARKQQIKAVFLLLDIDKLGMFPLTNQAIHYYLAPEVTGENRWRFWMRYLTAVQFKTWSFEIRRFRRERQVAAVIANAPPAAPNDVPQSVGVPKGTPPPAPKDDRPLGVALSRNMQADQLVRLGRFAELCRQHGVQLTVATSPLHRANSSGLNRAELDATVVRLRAIVPVWDFSDPNWVPDRPELWEDELHFVPEVSVMMLKEIFGGKS